MFKQTIDFIRQQFRTKEFIPLHEPKFVGNEKKYVMECIDSTFVSSVGKYVNEFEKKVCEYTGAKYAVATVNGTAALQIALQLAGVKANDLVLTQSLSFIATSNAIAYTGAFPLFIDVNKETLGLCPEKMEDYLSKNSFKKKDGYTYHKKTKQKISACVPMHTFGHPCKLDELVKVCKKYNIVLVEDAAESIGSFYKKKHTGIFGKIGTLSFNGNKTITCGGGGVIITNDEKLAKHGKHLTTQAKVPHAWEFVHDEIGYNYRLPNINAALALAQIENLPKFIESKRKLAEEYKKYFADTSYQFISEPKDAKSNYWLNAILLKDKKERDAFLKFSNENKVMTRPAWELTSNLKMYKHCIKGELEISKWIADRLVNIPSSVRIK